MAQQRACTLRARTRGLLAVLIGVACFDQSVVAAQQNGMILVPAGRSIVGTSDAERVALARRFDCHPTWLGDDLAKQEVTLAAFWIDQYPVTNTQYMAFVEAAQHPRPSWWSRWGGVYPLEYADHPVVGVSGQDAQAYAKWVGKRLPSRRAVGSCRRQPQGYGFCLGRHLAWSVKAAATVPGLLGLAGHEIGWRGSLRKQCPGYRGFRRAGS